MKWRVRKPRARYRALKLWHNYFAWFPVRVPTKGRMSGMTKVWLQKVRRRGELHCGYCDCYWSWEYKFIGD